MAPKTIIEKIWNNHLVNEEPGKASIIYIDLHLIHEVTSAQAFDGLRLHKRAVRRPKLTGEVRFPGRFTLTTRSDRLSGLIARAGGLTAEADADGAYFARMVDTVQSQRLALAEQQRTDGGARLDEVRTRIRVGVDLAAAMRERRRSDDLLLLQGDSIHVPKLLQTVEVRGAVNAPTALSHAGKKLGYYIDAAGGTTERARSRRAIRPSGGARCGVTHMTCVRFELQRMK